MRLNKRVCDIASEQLGIPRHRISPSDRIIEDLNCDSLDLVELLMEVEEAFGITLPENSTNPVFKAVFTRQPFRLSDLAELAYLQQGTGTPDRKGWRQARDWRPQLPLRRLPNSTVVGRFLPLESKGSSSRWKPRSQSHNTAADPMGCGAC